jgi:hypothetical protein
MYSDQDTNWSSVNSPHNFIRVTVYDKQFNSIDSKSLYLWVGNANINTQTRFDITDPYNTAITDGRLFVYDITSSTMLVNGVTVNTGQMLVNTPLGHDYVVWVNSPNRTFQNAFYDYYNLDHTKWQVSSYPSTTSNYTVIDGGSKTDHITLSATSSNPATISMITFNTIDSGSNLNIGNVDIHFSNVTPMDVLYGNNIGYNQIWQTDATGTLVKDFNTNIGYIGTASKSGYQSVVFNFTAHDGRSINIYMTGLGTPIPTATVTTFPTTESPNGTFGTTSYQPSNFIEWLENLITMAFGLGLGDAKVFIGLLVTVFFAALLGFMSRFQSGEAIGVGAIIGFSGSFALHLLPVLWVLIPIIFVTLYIVVKIWGKTGSGT